MAVENSYLIQTDRGAFRSVLTGNRARRCIARSLNKEQLDGVKVVVGENAIAACS